MNPDTIPVHNLKPAPNIENPRDEKVKDSWTVRRPGLNSFQGSIVRKPWNYYVTVCIPHRDTPELIEVIQPLYWYQTVKPYIMVMDTGSLPEVMDRLERMVRCDDTEIHYLRPHSSIHSSQPVAWSIDIAMTMCRTEYLFLTHSDMFPRSRSILEEFMCLCGPNNPVVGYSMSHREDIRKVSPYPVEYKNTPGHVATMLHMPTLRDSGIRYGFRQGEMWTDTEIEFGDTLKSKGIHPLILGVELNYVRQIDDRIDHCRSTTSLSMGNGLPTGKGEDIIEAMKEAVARAEDWKKEWNKYASMGFPS